MGSFGDNLRRERELRGISLEEIAQHTKLSSRVLEAIEKNRFDLLPGGMFNRSFVLHYARYLGLDELQVAADFDTAIGESSLDMRQVATQRDERRVPVTRDWLLVEKLQPLRGLLTGVLIAVVLVAAGIISVRRGWVQAVRAAVASRLQPPVPPPPAVPVPAAPSSPPAGAATAPPGVPQPGAADSPAAPASGTESAPPAGQAPGTLAGVAAAGGATTQPPKTIAGAEEQKPAGGVSGALLLLQIDTPLEGAWVRVIADGQEQWSGEMRPGESRRVRASAQIQLRTGNAGAVILTLNGETQPPLGVRGEVKTVNFSLQDVKKP